MRCGLSINSYPQVIEQPFEYSKPTCPTSPD